jgi:hypothetical protein
MTDTPQASDNILIQVYDSDKAPTADVARQADVAPKQEYQTHNVTRGVYHEAIVGALNGVTPDLTVDTLALGDSTVDTSTLSPNQPLGNEVFRTNTTDTFVDGQTFVASAFLDSTEANGENLTEAALIAEQPSGALPINRFLLDDPSNLLTPKTNNETVTIDIELRQEDA